MPFNHRTDAHNVLHAALAPLVDGDRLVAVRVYYVSATADGADVGVIERGGSTALREKLSQVIREAESGAIRAENLPGMVGDVPWGHA